MTTPTTTWQVTRQVADYQIIDLAGLPVTGVLVSFLTGAGNRGNLFVPDDQYANPANVQAALAAKAQLIDTIGSMTDQTQLGQLWRASAICSAGGAK